MLNRVLALRKHIVSLLEKAETHYPQRLTEWLRYMKTMARAYKNIRSQSTIHFIQNNYLQEK